MNTGIFHRARGLRRLALALSLVSLVAVSFVPALGAAQPAPPKSLGPVLSRLENPNVTLGRDGGFTVPLPNGQDFWLFADTPKLQYKQGAWRLQAFIPGSTAARGSFTAGKTPTARLTEVNLGRPLAPGNNIKQFLPSPHGVFMPGGGGKACNKANGQQSTTPVRWPSGAALMPDKTNILIPYVIVCLVSSYSYRAEGWGFATYNWKTNKFTQVAYDVYRPKADGSALDSVKFFGSPLFVGGKVTFFSWRCCSSGGGVYTTTFALSTAALKNPASYSPKLLPHVDPTWDLNVAPKSKTHARYSMFNVRNAKGRYDIYAASSPTGPWSKTASGVLPRCDKSPTQCHSLILHSELSASSRLLVSYHLPAYGPGVATQHPYPKEPLRHVVMASIPCNC